MTGNYFAALPVRVPAGWLEGLQAGAPDGLRWFHPGDLHLTLAFFGPADGERIPEIREVMNQIPFERTAATAGPMRPLPNPRRFSALSFELAEGREEVAELIAGWRSPLCEAARTRSDSRPPLPHLTVARPVRRELPRRRQRILAWAEGCAPPPGTLEILPPALYGWSPHRPERQFAVIPC